MPKYCLALLDLNYSQHFLKEHFWTIQFQESLAVANDIRIIITNRDSKSFLNLEYVMNNNG